MQNVSFVQRHPDTLISNFFIAGISQSTLREIFDPTRKEKLDQRVDVPSEILFSLYEENQDASAYLSQVFPMKVTIENQEKTLFDPKFFTFMGTDAAKETSYFHCLIFYERFAKELIHADFDETAAYTKLKRLEFVNRVEMDKLRQQMNKN